MRLCLPTSILFGLLFWGAFYPAAAQRLNNQWRFGNGGGGIDFNGAVPIAATGAAISTGEGSASVADPVTGQLLFYTDGVTVWNRNNVVMLNGNGLTGGTATLLSSTTAAMICPRPGNAQQYYIFTIDEQASNNGLRYSLVDMGLDGGLGGIVAGSKNILMLNTNSEKIQVVPHANGNSLWLVTHVPPNTFASFLINASGVSNAAVFSTLGNAHGNGAGHMKINKQFTQLAMGNFFESDIELFDFDWATGQFSNFRRWDFIPGGGFIYGVEFSPDGSRLYASNLGDVIQYDLSSGNLATIASSAVVIANQPFALPGTLQLGPDHRIYVAAGSIDRIDCPDNLGTASSYQLNAVPGSNGGGYGLPGWVYRAGDLPLLNLPNAIVLEDSCIESGARLRLLDTTKITQVRWNMGDPGSAANQQTGYTISHAFSSTGNFNITAVLDKNCGSPDTLRLTVNIIRCSQTGLTGIQFSGDTCNVQQPLQFSTSGNSASINFFWSFGDPASGTNDTLTMTSASTAVSHRFSSPGTYRVCVRFTEPGQPSREICRTLTIGNCCIFEIEDQRFCLDDTLRLQLSNGLADSVRWEIDGQSVLLAGNTDFLPTLSEPGSYPFTAVVYNTSCGIDTISGTLAYVDCNLSRCTLFAPNAFTPQGDGTNDVFRPVLGCEPEFYDLRIYSRWGQEVFRTTNPALGWNGKFKGEEAVQGTYQYVLYFRFAIGETRVSSGSLRLLR